jgi:ferredoxin-NADP reductase
MTDTILLSILGVILVNQLLAGLVHRSLGYPWPRLTITTRPEIIAGGAVKNRFGGRRATDHQPYISNYSAQRAAVLLQTFEAVGSSANRTSAQSSGAIQPVQSPQSSLGDEPNWSGWRKVRVDHCRDESPDCRSFRLVSVDEKPLPSFRAGQSILVSIIHPETGKRVSRCYSLSGGPNESFYRITVKRVPGGKLSNWLHDSIRVNDEIEIQAPRGSFHASDDLRNEPLVLIAAGIGITPMLSMFLENLEKSPTRPVEIFYQLRTPGNAPFLNLLRRSIEKCADTLPARLHVYFSQADGATIHANDNIGRLSAHAILQQCGASGDFMICGPTNFMSSVAEGLVAGGVAPEHVRYESFGAKSSGVGAIAVTVDEQAPADDPITSRTFKVRFDKSDRQADWTATAGSVLELGESLGLELDASCRSGDCGACVLKLRQGTVAYPSPPSCETKADEIVACVAQPSSDIRIEA